MLFKNVTNGSAAQNTNKTLVSKKDRFKKLVKEVPYQEAVEDTVKNSLSKNLVGLVVKKISQGKAAKNILLNLLWRNNRIKKLAKTVWCKTAAQNTARKSQS